MVITSFQELTVGFFVIMITKYIDRSIKILRCGDDWLLQLKSNNRLF